MNGREGKFAGAELTEAARAVETLLDRLIRPEEAPGEFARPERLVAAMRYAALGGGKRLRPALLVASARVFGVGGEEGALRAAAALECVHAYSLAHDDLPAMDDDDLRRGRPSLHRAFDEATAILAGDALLTLAFAILGDPATHSEGAVRAELVLLLARAAGVGGMVGGQLLDLAAEGRFEAGIAPLGAEAAEKMQAMKTGALFAFACEAGAVLGGASRADRERLAAFGAAIGAAFQLADDLLDLTGSAEAAGKAVGKDVGRGKANRAAILGAAIARQYVAADAAKALQLLAPFGSAAAALAATARVALGLDGGA